MPFYSKKQWRWAFATHQPWAREAAHKTKGGKTARYRRLPGSKHSGAKKTTRAASPRGRRKR